MAVTHTHTARQKYQKQQELRQLLPKALQPFLGQSKDDDAQTHSSVTYQFLLGEAGGGAETDAVTYAVRPLSAIHPPKTHV